MPATGCCDTLCARDWLTNVRCTIAGTFWKVLDWDTLDVLFIEFELYIESRRGGTGGGWSVLGGTLGGSGEPDLNTSLLEDSLLFLRLGGRGGGWRGMGSSSIARDTSSAVGTFTLDIVCDDWVHTGTEMEKIIVNTLHLVHFFFLYKSDKFISAGAWQNRQNDLCTQQRLRSAWASAQSDQRLRCPHEESLGP